MKRYRARSGKIVNVGGRKVTDDKKGSLLPSTPALRNHLKCRRLIEVGKANAKVASKGDDK